VVVAVEVWDWVGDGSAIGKSPFRICPSDLGSLPVSDYPR